MDAMETWGTRDHRLSNPRWRQHRCGVMGWRFVERHLFALHDFAELEADSEHIPFCMNASHRQAQRWLRTSLGTAFQSQHQASS